MPCKPPSDVYQFENAFRSFFGVLTTHILAGAVDTTLADATIWDKISWLIRYFNPVNLCWRYYSILAYRCMASNWTEKQLALINYEGYPYRAPIPYIVGEKMDNYRVKRLEISGIQVLLSFATAYQGILAVQYAAIASAGIGFLPSITKPLAILGLFRVMVSHWIASKVYVKPYPYPSQADIEMSGYRSNKIVTCCWVVAFAGLVILSFWPYIGYPQSSIPQKHYMDLCIQSLYQYVAISMLIFHAVLLSHGSKGLSNRLVCFDHWIYKAQTCGFVVILTGTLVFGILDFVEHDFYRNCAF